MPRPLFFLASLIALAGISACQPAAPPAPVSALVDDIGVPLPAAQPLRIVPLAPNITELLYALGAGDRVVGVSVADDYPPAIEGLPRFSSLPMDFEALAALRPDLLVAATQVNNPRDAELFASLGIPIAYFDFDEVADVFRVMRTLGAALGLQASADSAAARLEADYGEIRRLTASADTRPSVVFLIGSDPLFAFGRGSYVHDMIDAAGGRSLTAEIDTPAPTLSEEFVLTAAPDVIAGTLREGASAELARLYPSWRLTPALRDGRIYRFAPSLFLRPGPRLVEGARQLARQLHPDIFARLDGAGS
ncbi:MAG: helical backbone metal receptor [Rhodothermales bacterium]|nr:helical backbone metal receptor [Rhodothermales bacterium]